MRALPGHVLDRQQGGTLVHAHRSARLAALRLRRWPSSRHRLLQPEARPAPRPAPRRAAPSRSAPSRSAPRRSAASRSAGSASAAWRSARRRSASSRSSELEIEELEIGRLTVREGSSRRASDVWWPPQRIKLGWPSCALALGARRSPRRRPRPGRRPLPRPRLLPGLPRPARLALAPRPVPRRPRRPGTRTSRRRRATRARPPTSPTSTPTAATTCTPTSARRAPTASPTRSSAPASAKLPIHYTAYGDESDPGPFPVPAERAGRGRQRQRRRPPRARRRPRRLQALRALPRLLRRQAAAALERRLRGPTGTCARPPCRPDGWTSADAAGLPIFPGLVRYDEVAAGHLDHAIRVTFDSTRNAWVHPASHCAGDTSNPSAPPMGLRLRLKAGYGLGGFSGPAQDDRRGDEALRPDRRRQRLQLVLLRQQRPPLGRREPRTS